MGCLTVDDTPITTDSTPMDNLDINHVTVQSISNRRIAIPIEVETEKDTENLNALIDCGAEGMFIDKKIASNWRKKKLAKPINVQNVDGTQNTDGKITDKCLVTFNIKGKCLMEWFHVTSCKNGPN